jgi:pseudouridine-5'-phosphate glycosidase
MPEPAGGRQGAPPERAAGVSIDIAVADEVRAALDARRPVVALESTIVAHGLPWPENLDVGRALEDEVRAGGAVPATIAVLGGEARVGLAAAELERVARGGKGFAKSSAADLAVHMARGADAATTVAGTVCLAAQAGIAILATGGIGGVHRGAPWDVSNDLSELAARRVAVVSAGAKAILDLARTAEMLESLGVLVLGVRTSELPAFYTPWSGVPLEHRVETAGEVAAVLRARWRLGQGGVLVANPIPPEAALDPAFIDGIVAASLAQADREGVRGKALTPYLLADLERKSGGATVRANRALALANARLAAEVAVAFAA